MEKGKLVCPSQDREGQIKSTFVKTKSVKKLRNLQKSRPGDFLGVEGEVMRTDMGELSIKATHITHLSKALRPLPKIPRFDRR